MSLANTRLARHAGMTLKPVGMSGLGPFGRPGLARPIAAVTADAGTSFSHPPALLFPEMRPMIGWTNKAEPPTRAPISVTVVLLRGARMSALLWQMPVCTVVANTVLVLLVEVEKKVIPPN